MAEKSRSSMVRSAVESLDLDTLLFLAEQLAGSQADGHLTILRFTTEWKCMLGTPDLRGGEGADEVGSLPGFASLREALIHLICH